MSRWFRVYDDMVDDPKVQRLRPDLFKALVNLWCLASKNDGVLPPVDEIAFKLRLSTTKTHRIVDELTACGLVDETETEGERAPHNWGIRQFKSDVSNERVKRHRERKCNVTPPVTVTPPETEQIQNRKKDAAPNGAHPEDSEETDLFRRGKQVLGPTSGGLIAKLLKAKNGSIPKARSAIEQAAEKQNPREYVGRIAAGAATDPEHIREIV